MGSKFVLVDRRLNTPGVVVARSDSTTQVELFFKQDVSQNNETKVRITQESTGLGITMSPHEPFKFTLCQNDALWAASTNDIICWQVWS